MNRRAALADARLYLIVSPEVLGLAWQAAVAAALSSKAVDIVQLRAKTWDDDRIREEGAALRRDCHRAGVLFVLNDRPDLARAIDADGVHVGEEDAALSEARTLVGDGRIVGCSTHDAAELRAVEGADYAGLGPCFATGSKTLERPPQGPALLEGALPAAPAGIPVFPIGGIAAENLPALIAVGATRAAVGAGVLSQPDPAAAARHLAALLKGDRLDPPGSKSTSSGA